MDCIRSLLFEHSALQAVIVLSLISTLGIVLGKIRIFGVSLGTAFIFFVGILAGHLGLSLDPAMLVYAESFGLILFVYALGLQVGPGFFSSLRSDGIRLLTPALLVLTIGTLAAIGLSFACNIPIADMSGILCGATTNTPALGAAQQMLVQLGRDTNGPALSCALTYPLGVVGIIMTLIIIRFITRVDFAEENKALEAISSERTNADKLSVVFTNGALEGQNIAHLRELINRSFVISRIMHEDGTIVIADGDSVLKIGDRLRVICSADDSEAVVALTSSPKKTIRSLSSREKIS